MKTLALVDGDLVLAGDRYGMVEGAARVQQSISLCMRERIGIDRFHPSWGSVLPNWIGRQVLPGVENDVRMEVERVIRNLMQSQATFIKRRTNEGRTPPIAADEMISSIQSVQTSQVDDVIAARISLRTMGHTEFDVLSTPEGI